MRFSAFITDALRGCGLPEADASIVAGAMFDSDLYGPGCARRVSAPRLCARASARPHQSARQRQGDRAQPRHRSGRRRQRHGPPGDDLRRQTGGRDRARSGRGLGRRAAVQPFRRRLDLCHDPDRARHGGYLQCGSGSNFMAPWGGAEPLLGTNPIAVGIPAGKEAPIVLDIATSVASNGMIRTYATQGRPLPEGWVMSRADGQPITDGNRLAEGSFVPMGTYKGSGLAIVLGLLGGPLNRAAFGRDCKDAASTAGARNQYRAFHDRARRRALPAARRRSGPRSIGISTISRRPSGCPASTKSAFRGRGGRRAAPTGRRTACRSHRRCASSSTSWRRHSRLRR